MNETATTPAVVQVINYGLCYLTVCAVDGTPAEELERVANREAPTGISSRWEVSDDETFSGGQPNPCPCDQVEGRQHTLLEC